MDDLSAADVKQIYVGGLILYRGMLVFTDHFDGFSREMHIINLVAKKQQIVPFKQSDFKPLANRIGMVNMMKSVIFVSRTTKRQYSACLTQANSNFLNLGPIYYPLSRDTTYRAVRKLNTPEILRAYNNEYPSLDEAYKKAVEWKGACAFDKQFAITYDGKVFYRSTCIGKFEDGKFILIPEYEYLKILLEKGYEKDSRTFKATPLSR